MLKEETEGALSRCESGFFLSKASFGLLLVLLVFLVLGFIWHGLESFWWRVGFVACVFLLSSLGGGVFLSLYEVAGGRRWAQSRELMKRIAWFFWRLGGFFALLFLAMGLGLRGWEGMGGLFCGWSVGGGLFFTCLWVFFLRASDGAREGRAWVSCLRVLFLLGFLGGGILWLNGLLALSWEKMGQESGLLFSLLLLPWHLLVLGVLLFFCLILCEFTSEQKKEEKEGGQGEACLQESLLGAFLGTWMLALVLIHAYTGYSLGLISWFSEKVPRGKLGGLGLSFGQGEGAFWAGLWGWILVLCVFVLPLLLLLLSGRGRSVRLLKFVVFLVLLGIVLEGRFLCGIFL